MILNWNSPREENIVPTQWLRNGHQVWSLFLQNIRVQTLHYSHGHPPPWACTKAVISLIPWCDKNQEAQLQCNLRRGNVYANFIENRKAIKQIVNAEGIPNTQSVFLFSSYQRGCRGEKSPESKWLLRSTPGALLVGAENGTAATENSLAGLQKAKHKIATPPGSSMLRCLPQRTES